MKLIHGMTPIEFDDMIASRYTMKVHDAKQRGKPFELTLSQFRALYKRAKCAYTGAPLVFKRPAGGGTTPWNYATLERVDNEKGYVLGNVVVITHEANGVKSVFENNKTSIDVRCAVKMFSKVGELLKKAA